MKRILCYIILGYILCFYTSCSEDINQPITKDSGIPGNVTEIGVENIEGGAIISYKLPTDNDLLCIEARYRLSSGEDKIVRASYHSRKIKVEGFASTDKQSIYLTSIDRAENRSIPVEVEISPLTPPVKTIEESITILPDFGGINLKWENTIQTPVAMLIYGKNENDNEDVLLDTYYSSMKQGDYSLRGLDTIPYNFKIVVRDKWQNYSDTINKAITPIFEVKLDSKKFKALPAAFSNNITSGSISQLWDGDKESNAPSATIIPWNGSIDLGGTVKLSRIVFWQYGWAFNNYGHYYAWHNGRFFNIYGSNAPSGSGALDDSWTLLRQVEIIKPSGLPFAVGRENMTDEDYDIARNYGHEFTIPLESAPYRYIRIEGLESFLNGTEHGTSSEVEFYGDTRH